MIREISMRQASNRHRASVAFALAAMAALSGCAKGGPGFFKQSGAEKQPESLAVATTETPGAKAGAVIVATIVDGLKTKGSLLASSTDTQILAASPESGIGAAKVAFPPGALGIDTEVTLTRADAAVADTLLAEDLGIETVFSAAGTPVSIQALTAQDAAQAFTVSLDLPSVGAALAGDPYENLVVVYRVTKAGEGREFNGLIPRSGLVIVGGSVSFDTQFFGTFQAAITKKTVTVAKEVERGKAAPRKAVVKARWQGPQLTSFGDGEPRRSDGFQGFGLFLAPWRVAGTKSQLSTGLVLNVATPSE